jgi:SPP1 family predicted phage head-tail adaptor
MLAVPARVDRLTAMKSGKLDRRVVIVRPTHTTNSHNEQIEGVPTKMTTWASVRAMPGQERYANAQREVSAPLLFTFRWRADLVRETDRIEHDGRVFEVTSAVEVGRRAGLEVQGIWKGATV